jgi:NADH:ubiquinone reductase (H+-translocating)
MTKIVIVGAGFGGLAAARNLAAHTKNDVQITIIDRRNHHLFQPLLYQVAMAGLSPAEIAIPVRTVMSPYKNAEVLLGHVDRVEASEQYVLRDGEKIQYDYLVLACGSIHSYFGNENWESHAPGLKNIEQATEIRRRVLEAFEQAECVSDPETQKELLTFVVVGGGPTGVELAGALGEISRYTLSKDFRHIDPRRTRIILIEAGPCILPSFDERLSRRATRDLEMLGVTVWTSTKVTDIRSDGVALGKEFVRARTVLWAAGVKASPLGQCLNTELDRSGRVLIQPDLSVAKYPNVFVIGDQSLLKDESGKPLPGLAPVAMQQGWHAAKNILSLLNGRQTEPFRYLDKGQMATIGRRQAIAEFKGVRLTGFIAWLAWLLVHVYYLIGFRNRLFVLLQWTWAYLFYKRGARLIVGKEWRSSSTLE